MTPALSVQGLTFQYASGSIPALIDVELKIEPGELVLVAGPSGCGKSTLIKCLNGLIPRSYKGSLAGAVELFGQPRRPACKWSRASLQACWSSACSAARKCARAQRYQPAR